jgi:hypothetical protein
MSRCSTATPAVSRPGRGRSCTCREGRWSRTFDLILAIVVEPPATVRLSRPTNEPCQQQFGVVWRLQEGEDGTRIELSLDADLRVPRFLPVGGIGNSMAKGFVAAARRALASRGRP